MMALAIEHGVHSGVKYTRSMALAIEHGVHSGVKYSRSMKANVHQEATIKCTQKKNFAAQTPVDMHLCACKKISLLRKRDKICFYLRRKYTPPPTTQP